MGIGGPRDPVPRRSSSSGSYRCSTSRTNSDCQSPSPTVGAELRRLLQRRNGYWNPEARRRRNNNDGTVSWTTSFTVVPVLVLESPSTTITGAPVEVPIEIVDDICSEGVERFECSLLNPPGEESLELRGDGDDAGATRHVATDDRGDRRRTRRRPTRRPRRPARDRPADDRGHHRDDRGVRVWRRGLAILVSRAAL